jgi:hypothetical protein
MRLIGDVHGYIDTYRNIIKDAEYSVQLGDMGFGSDYDKLIEYVDCSRHKFIPGNHDNYNRLPPHAFPRGYDFVKFGNLEFFYVTGALSVDKRHRIKDISWWEQEELTYQEGNDMLSMYEKIKPDIILSHDCPQSVLCLVASNSMKIDMLSYTSKLFQEMLNIHKPQLWCFGHHHYSRDVDIQNTTFQCIGELKYIDI